MVIILTKSERIWTQRKFVLVTHLWDGLRFLQLSPDWELFPAWCELPDWED